jgi:hypothetical protein
MIVKAVEGARNYKEAVKSLQKPSNPEIFDSEEEAARLSGQSRSSAV